jgi:hypothetical protein
MSRTSALAPPLPLDWTDAFGPTAHCAEDEGPIFLCGLDDLLIRLEAQPGYHPLDRASGNTLEALADLLAAAGVTR